MSAEQSKSKHGMTVGEYERLIRQGFHAESPELNDVQRSGMVAMQNSMVAVRDIIDDAFYQIPKKILSELHSSLKARGEEFHAIGRASMFGFTEKVREIIASINANKFKTVAWHAVDSLRNNDLEEYADTIDFLNVSLNESENRIASLNDYTRWVFEFTDMELKAFEEKIQELTVEKERLLGDLDIIHKGHKQSDDGVAKAGFIKWVIDENIILEQIVDLHALAGYGALFENGIFKKRYPDKTLKGWYSQAMPNVDLPSN